MYFLQTLMAGLYRDRPFPWNWAMYLPILVAVSFAGAFIAIGLLRWTRPHIGPYWELFRQSWKIIMVVSMDRRPRESESGRKSRPASFDFITRSAPWTRVDLA